MAFVIENYSKFEVRAVVKIFASRRSESEQDSSQVSVCGQNVFRQKEVSGWCNKFKDGQTALYDDPQKHRGRTRTSHTVENYVIVKGLIREDR
jgi:hypothetical protein